MFFNLAKILLLVQYDYGTAFVSWGYNNFIVLIELFDGCELFLVESGSNFGGCFDSSVYFVSESYFFSIMNLQSINTIFHIGYEMGEIFLNVG